MPPKASKDVDLGDELIVKSSDLLFMRDNVSSVPPSSSKQYLQSTNTCN